VRVLIVLMSMTAIAASGHADDVQLLDPRFFGQPTSAPVRLLFDKSPDEHAPYLVQTDIKCDVYYAATVFYRHPITAADVRTSLRQHYSGYEARVPSTTGGAVLPDVWRVLAPGPTATPEVYGASSEVHPGGILAVSLSEGDDEGVVKVIYIEGRLRSELSCPDDE
jgi:hypothetical protein